MTDGENEGDDCDKVICADVNHVCSTITARTCLEPTATPYGFHALGVGHQPSNDESTLTPCYVKELAQRCRGRTVELNSAGVSVRRRLSPVHNDTSKR